MAPTDRDYLTLKPGESVSGIASLWDNYDLSVSGTYLVQYKTEVLSRDSDRAVAFSNVLFLDIEGREPPLDPDDVEEDGPITKIVNGSNEKWKSCSDSEKNDLVTARQHALNYADDSYDYLVAGTSTSRYTTWFGANDSSRYGTVREHFRKIRNAMDNETFKFFCNCNKNNAYAFVRPRQEYKIHLCPPYWSAPMTGTDSKAGTLVHEVSHFRVVADTDDIQYGPTAAAQLASSNPGDAIRNADSHEYFAEATPYSPYNPCAPTVTSHTGAPITASWDGANCHVMNVPAGLTPFVYNNAYYVNALPGTSCPAPSGWDTANCYILPYPSWSTSYFVWSGNLYLTPGPGNACPAPSTFDGANCYVMPLPWGSAPFKYANNLYITPPPNCPIGGFDGAHCLVGTAPASRTAFIWGSSFYYAH
jgi:peptidyl-Lys metalloendopeptidase